MPSKIESSLAPEMLQEFFKRCAQLKGTKLKDIQVLASEFEIDISLMSASAFRDGAFARHLEKITRSKEKIEQLQALMADGTDTIDAALKVTADDLFDRITSGDEVDPLDTSLIISRLMKSRATKDTVEQNAQKLLIAQLDAAGAVLQHAAEIKLVIADNKLDAPAKTERVRKILFGEKPADFKPVTSKGVQSE